tara:strand:- start:534 stop:734 length:201 start_codon:yes stop_codon:yes gene_type:complete
LFFYTTRNREKQAILFLMEKPRTAASFSTKKKTFADSKRFRTWRFRGGWSGGNRHVLKYKLYEVMK